MMAQCHLSWDSYKKNICEGFSILQQQEELVDMTLAAEGHLVKVHKSLLALASPYLKSIIQSAPCQHPVVFLTHLKHKILGYILEFVYTGEVALPTDDLSHFIDACKALHITGACDLIPPAKFQKKEAAHSIASDLDKVQGKKIVLNTSFRFNEDSREKTMEINNDHGEKTGLTYQVEDAEDYNREKTKTFNYEIIKEESDTENVFAQTEDNGVQNVTSINLCDDDMDIDNECVSFQYGSHDKPLETCSNIKMVETESDQNNTYSINVEMPDGKKGPPKITIQAGMIENLPVTSGSLQNKRLHSIGKEMTSGNNSNSMPKITVDARNSKITIDAGMIHESPGTSSTKGDLVLPNPDTTKLDNICNSPSPYYILSSKGSLQIILNRFLYGLHHHAKQGRKIRWRCVDYRHNHCPAYIDTLGEVVVSRKFMHNHPFHDDKIMSKGSTRKVYESLDEISRELAKRKKSSELI